MNALLKSVSFICTLPKSVFLSLISGSIKFLSRWVYSADAAQAGDYIEAYHNQTNGIITTGGGDLDLSGASGDVQVDGTFTIEGTNNNCILTIDDDGTCDAGTSIGSDSSIAICAVCASN